MRRKSTKITKDLMFAVGVKYMGKGMLIVYKDDMEGGTANLESKIIRLEKNYYDKPSEWGFFTLLHEIGHIMTNNNKQKRCLQEYLATQFAIDKCKEYGVVIPEYITDTYQDYILKWRETGLKHRAKNMPSISQLTLKY